MSFRFLFFILENCNIATNGSTSSNASSYHSAHQNHQQNHQFNNYHNAFQHQSSVTSVSSVQTVLNQSLQNSTNINRLIENVCQNGNNFNLNTFGSCSSLITTNGHVSSNGSTIRDNMNSGVSVSSAEEPLSVGDVADLLHPQYAIITGKIDRFVGWSHCHCLYPTGVVIHFDWSHLRRSIQGRLPVDNVSGL